MNVPPPTPPPTPPPPPEVKCPKCGSNQLFAGKKGFSGKKAVAGAVLTGGIGIFAGTIGSNKIKITCLNCGHVFKPGDTQIQTAPASTADYKAKLEEDNKKILAEARFMNRYKRGDKDAALIDLQHEYPEYSIFTDPDAAYRKVKSEEQSKLFGCVLVIILIVAAIIYFIVEGV